VTKPSRKGPWIALVLSAYVAGRWFVNIFMGDDGVAASLLVFAIGVAMVVMSWRWLWRRLGALECWKAEREMAWWLKDLPEEDN
jgi:hypothetical protein